MSVMIENPEKDFLMRWRVPWENWQRRTIVTASNMAISPAHYQGLIGNDDF